MFLPSISAEDIQDAKQKTDTFLSNARVIIQEKVHALQDYDPNVVDVILCNLVSSIDDQNKKNVCYKFTLEYQIDICIVVASYAAKEMIEMVNKLHYHNNPIKPWYKLFFQHK